MTSSSWYRGLLVVTWWGTLRERDLTARCLGLLLDTDRVGDVPGLAVSTGDRLSVCLVWPSRRQIGIADWADAAGGRCHHGSRGRNPEATMALR